jgi:hypothetical protein
MKGKIDKYGHLYIIRVRAEIAQFCPLHDNDLDGRLHVCGDWCPLFGEPYPHTERRNPFSALDLSTELTGKTALSLCHKTLIFDEFTDEREETNENI